MLQTPVPPAQRENTSTALCRLRTRFHKTGDAIFLSHLDLSRLMERALRRAELPIAYSQGFNPHPRMVFGAALAVGTESEAEYADFFLRRDISPGEFQKRLNEALPEGVAVSEVRWVDLAAPALTAEVRAADYRVLLLGEISGEERDAFLRQEAIVLARGEKKVNIRPLILLAEVVTGEVSDESGGDGKPSRSGREAFLRLRAGGQGNLRPEDFFSALSSFLERPIDLLWIKRTELWAEKNGRLTSLWE